MRTRVFYFTPHRRILLKAWLKSISMSSRLHPMNAIRTVYLPTERMEFFFIGLGCQNFFRICSAWISVLKGYPDLKLRGQLQILWGHHPKDAHLCTISKIVPCLMATGVVSEFNRAEIMNQILSRVHPEIVPILKAPPAGPAQGDCKSPLSAPLEILQFS